jgi:hypothetical protein
MSEPVRPVAGAVDGKVIFPDFVEPPYKCLARPARKIGHNEFLLGHSAVTPG